MPIPSWSNALSAILLPALLLGWSPSPAAAEESKTPWLPKGRTIWGLSGSFGVADGNRAGSLESVCVVMARTLTNPVGPRWIRGRMGVLVELVPLFLLSQKSTSYAAGFNLLGRHYLDRGGSLRPFLTLGAGMIVSNEEIPERVANLNFTPQAGLGLLFSDKSERVYSAEFRLHHISNGGRVEPNPGINSLVFQFAILFPNRRARGLRVAAVHGVRGHAAPGARRRESEVPVGAGCVPRPRRSRPPVTVMRSELTPAGV